MFYIIVKISAMTQSWEPTYLLIQNKQILHISILALVLCLDFCTTIFERCAFLTHMNMTWDITWHIWIWDFWAKIVILKFKETNRRFKNLPKTAVIYYISACRPNIQFILTITILYYHGQNWHLVASSDDYSSAIVEHSMSPVECYIIKKHK